MSNEIRLTQHGVFTTEITAEAFAPYGELLNAHLDDEAVTPAEAALDLSQGLPRFYVMDLPSGRSTFTGITRHRHVTQVLASVGGGRWWMAVAPAGAGSGDEGPALDDIVGFEISGEVAVLLHRGTWHAGPFFGGSRMTFYNLELADTNTADHDTSLLDERLGIECWFDRPRGS